MSSAPASSDLAAATHPKTPRDQLPRKRHVPALTLPLHGWTVVGTARSAVEAVVLRHLIHLGAQPQSGEGLRVAHDGQMLDIAVDWAGLDEPTAQAAYGLMAVHGWAQGSGPQRLAVDYVTTAVGVIATQGALAALLSGLRGRPIAAAGTAVANAALVTVSQYLAAASADDPDYAEPVAHNGTPPPFESSDGILFELETLDPQPWAEIWTALGVAPGVIARAWKVFVLRYATATASLPAELHQATRELTFEQLRQAADRAGVAIQPVRAFGERLADLDGQLQRLGRPWTIRSGPNRAPLPIRGMDSAAPLSGLLVVEAGRRIQGPLAGHMLRLLGAEVVRIEPVGGDPLRGMPPMVGDCSARFLALNRGKRVVEADLRTASGRETVRDLARDADVFLHNLAPGKAARMGLDAEDLLKINQGLVYAYASGWGEERGGNPPPGTDFVAQAYSGLAHNVRPVGHRPAGSLMTLLDVLGGLIAAEGVVAALLKRHRTGRGQRISSSLLSAAGVLQSPIAESAAAAQPVWGVWDAPVPTAEGHVMVAAGSRPPRSLSPRDLASQSTAEALATLRSAGLCAVAVCADLAALATDPAVSPFVEFDGCAFVRPPWRFTP